MPSFRPPFSERSTEELIEIVHSSADQWSRVAIEQARTELAERKVSRRREEEVLENLRKESKRFLAEEAERLERNSTESYHLWEMVVLFIFGPVLILRPRVFNSHTLFTLRSENYILKFKQRIMIFALSFISWFLYIDYAAEESEKARIEEINKVDISDWEKNFKDD